MKKAIFVVLLALLYAKPSVAQTDSINYEIGFSTQIIFANIFRSDGAPVELMLKKRTGEQTWMRYGLTAFYTSYDNIEFQYQNISSSGTISPAVGIEKRVSLSPAWIFQYGGDIHLSYSFNKHEQRTLNSTDFSESVRETDRQTYGGGIRPFIGITYAILPRLYVATEASIQLTAARTHHWGNEEDYNSIVRQFSEGQCLENCVNEDSSTG